MKNEGKKQEKVHTIMHIWLMKESGEGSSIQQEESQMTVQFSEKFGQGNGESICQSPVSGVLLPIGSIQHQYPALLSNQLGAVLEKEGFGTEIRGDLEDQQQQLGLLLKYMVPKADLSVYCSKCITDEYVFFPTK